MRLTCHRAAAPIASVPSSACMADSCAALTRCFMLRAAASLQPRTVQLELLHCARVAMTVLQMSPSPIAGGALSATKAFASERARRPLLPKAAQLQPAV